MNIFRRGQHADRLHARTRPAPAEVAETFQNISLMEPAETFPVPGPVPPRPAPPVPAPVHGPASLPPLLPAPPPSQPRMAWVPDRRSARPPAPVPITEPAAIAREDGRFAGVCSVRCQRQGCTQFTSRGGTRSFTALYAAAVEDGWRKDYWDAWMCPACQQKPGYWPASVPVPVTARAEVALTWDAKEAAGDDDYQLCVAIQYVRYLKTPPDAGAFEAVTA